MFWKKKKAPVEEPPQPKKRPKLDMSGFTMRMTMKSIIFYERLSGKSYFKMTEEDLPMLLYAVFMTNNRDKKDCKGITFKQFEFLLKEERFARWIMSEYMDTMAIEGQLADKVEATEVIRENKESSDEEVQSFSKIASMLVVDLGIDAHYVMEEMSLWEIPGFTEAFRLKDQSEWERERLWTFYQILPHIDGKKLKSPEKLIEFPWEKENKQLKAKKKLTDEGIKATLAMWAKQREEQNNG